MTAWRRFCIIFGLGIHFLPMSDNRDSLPKCLTVLIRGTGRGPDRSHKERWSHPSSRESSPTCMAGFWYLRGELRIDAQYPFILRKVLDIWGLRMATLTHDGIGPRGDTVNVLFHGCSNIWWESGQQWSNVWSSWHNFKSKYAKTFPRGLNRKNTTHARDVLHRLRRTWLWEHVASFWLHIVHLGQVCAPGNLLHVSTCETVLPGGRQAQMGADKASSHFESLTRHLPTIYTLFGPRQMVCIKKTGQRSNCLSETEKAEWIKYRKTVSHLCDSKL